jgi:membrane fusion protein, multidrug efflux system
MRLRLIGAGAILVSLTIGMTAPAAADPELETKRDQVSRDIEQLRHDLAETSHQLVAAAVALREAEAHLPGAQAVLEQARGELAAAQARDQQAQRELKVA